MQGSASCPTTSLPVRVAHLHHAIPMSPRSRSTPIPLVLMTPLILAISGCHGTRAGAEPPAAAADPVLVGYGTQPRGEVTGAVASVSAEEIDRVQGQTMERFLEGRIPGLMVVRRGRDVALSIRGGGPPHVVIDGANAAVADLLALSPESVQRLDVRKDGGAAVYGFRGANGVIEVTTRRGRPR